MDKYSRHNKFTNKFHMKGILMYRKKMYTNELY